MQRAFTHLPRLKLWMIALFILILPVLLYFVPYPLSFNGEVYTYDFRWESFEDDAKTYTILKEMRVIGLNVTGEGLQADGKNTQGILTFADNNQIYSIQDLEVQGSRKFRVMFNDGQGKIPDLLSIEIEADKISFNLVNATSKAGNWNYQQDQQIIKVEGQNNLPINANYIQLIAYLIKNHRNDLFSIQSLPLPVAKNSMLFSNSKGQSTILGGKISPYNYPNDIQLTEKQYAKFSSDGITKLNELSLSRYKKQDQEQDKLCLLAQVTGKTHRIEIGQARETVSKTYQFNVLEVSIGSENAKSLVTGVIIVGFFGLLFEIVKSQLNQKSKS